MNIDTNNLVSITEANQNFSKIARMVDENGSVVILKNNAPRYVLVEFNEFEKTQQASDEDVLALSKSLMEKNKKLGINLMEKVKKIEKKILNFFIIYFMGYRELTHHLLFMKIYSQFCGVPSNLLQGL